MADFDKKWQVDFGKRLKAVRGALRFTQRDFAALLGISPGFLSTVEKGSQKPGIKVCFLLREKFAANLNYIFTGDGPMFFEAKGVIPSPVDVREYIEHIRGEEDLLWLMKKSHLFRDSVMAYARSFHLTNGETIKKDIALSKGEGNGAK